MREYRHRDAKDIPDAVAWDMYFGTLYKDTMLRIMSFLEGRSRRRFVAYSLLEKKAVGTIFLDEITSTLWHVGGIFVTPSHRRKGVAGIINDYVDNYTKSIGVKKRVGNIELINLPSIGTAAKSGFKFLSQPYYRCDGLLPAEPSAGDTENSEDITLASFRSSDLDALYGVYQRCVNDEWRSILEIDKENFLERFFGYTRSRGLLKLWVRNRVGIIKENGDIVGYFHHTKRLSPIKMARQEKVYLYLLPSKQTKNTMVKIFSLMRREGYKEISLYFTNMDRLFMEETASILQNDFQFNKRKYLVFCF